MPPSQGGDHRFKSGTGYAEEDSTHGLTNREPAQVPSVIKIAFCEVRE